MDFGSIASILGAQPDQQYFNAQPAPAAAPSLSEAMYAMPASSIQQAPQAQPQAAPQQHHGLFGGNFLGGLRNVMGSIGDALLIANGAEPIHANKVRNEQLGTALSNYLGNSDASLAAIARQDPGTFLKLFQMTHEKADKSDQPTIAKEVDYYRSIGRDDLAEEALARHAEGPPLIGNNGDGTWSIIPPSMIHGQQGAPAAQSGPPSSAVDYLKAHPDLAGHFDEKYGSGAAARALSGGGATGSTPSGTFPNQ